MVDEPDNLVLHHLREVRAQMAGFRSEMIAFRDETKPDIARLKSSAQNLEDGQALILGYLTQAKWRGERLARDVTHLSNRVTLLEVHTNLTPTS